MPNLNQSLRDRVVRHELYLKKLANAEVAAVRDLLTAAEVDIQKQIERRLTWIAERGFDSSPFTLRRLEANLKEVRAVARAAYRGVGKGLKSSLLKVAKHEAGWAAGAVAGELSGVGVELGVGVAEGSLLSAIVNKQPFQGALLKDWAAKLGEDTFHSVRGAVRQGLLQGESVPDIVRRLRGTKAAGYSDGILAVRRRNAEAVVRTAVSSVANSAREATWKANDDIVRGVQWVSTLDDRTTPECAVRDGLVYGLDYEPRGHSVPWGDGPGALHWNCRSTSAPVLATWKELGIDAREVTGEQRAALDGMVPSTQNFGEWLGHMRDQGRLPLVENVLGKKRAAAFMAHQIRFKDLFNRAGDFLTLDELALADPGTLLASPAVDALFGYDVIGVPMNDELRALKVKIDNHTRARVSAAKAKAKKAGLSDDAVRAAGDEAATKFSAADIAEYDAAVARARAAAKTVAPPVPPVVVPKPVVPRPVAPPTPPPVVVPKPVPPPPVTPPVVKPIVAVDKIDPSVKWDWSLPADVPMTDELKLLKYNMKTQASSRASAARKAGLAAGKTDAEIRADALAAWNKIPARQLELKAEMTARAIAGTPLPPARPLVKPKLPVGNLPPAVVATPPTSGALAKLAKKIEDLVARYEKAPVNQPWSDYVKGADEVRDKFAAELFDLLPKGTAQMHRLTEAKFVKLIDGEAKPLRERLESMWLSPAEVDLIEDSVKRVDDFFARVVTNPKLAKVPKDLQVQFSTKPNHRGGACEVGKYITLPTDRNLIRQMQVTAHEYAHHIEYNNRWVLDEVKAFIKRRVGLDAKSGAVIGGGAGENGWADKFVSQYTGKVYGRSAWGGSKYFSQKGLLKRGLKVTDDLLDNVRASEVLTMGVEQMVQNPMKFFRSDPDFFKFILGILTGLK